MTSALLLRDDEDSGVSDEEEVDMVGDIHNHFIDLFIQNSSTMIKYF